LAGTRIDPDQYPLSTSVPSLLSSILKEFPMRVPVLTILALGMVWAATPAQAQTYDPAYPVCMHLFGRDGDYYDCSFFSIEQCRATASGRAAQCDINPYYVGARAPLRHDRRYRRAY
jgi:hypothetical protein